jgi:hypothetical protein
MTADCVLRSALNSAKQAPLGIRREANQEIDIAVRAEILSQGRSEEGKLGDLPAAAELFETAGWSEESGKCGTEHEAALEAASRL